MLRKFLGNLIKDVKAEAKRELRPSQERAMFIECSELAQKLINELHAKNPDSPVFDQAGILSGHDQVLDWLQYDWCLAVEHLLYMIYETQIKFSEDRLSFLLKLEGKCPRNNNYADKFSRG